MPRFYINTNTELTRENFSSSVLDDTIPLNSSYISSLDKYKWYFVEYDGKPRYYIDDLNKKTKIKISNMSVDGAILKWACEEKNIQLNFLFIEESTKLLLLCKEVTYGNFKYIDNEWTIYTPIMEE